MQTLRIPRQKGRLHWSYKRHQGIERRHNGGKHFCLPPCIHPSMHPPILPDIHPSMPPSLYREHEAQSTPSSIALTQVVWHFTRFKIVLLEAMRTFATSTSFEPIQVFHYWLVCMRICVWLLKAVFGSRIKLRSQSSQSLARFSEVGILSSLWQAISSRSVRYGQIESLPGGGLLPCNAMLWWRLMVAVPCENLGEQLWRS